MADSERLDSAVAIVLLTAVSYAAAFAYEAAYLNHFGVPVDFVEIDLRSLLLCAAALLSLGGLIMMLNGLLMLWPTHLPKFLQIIIVRTIVMVGGIALLGIAGGATFYGWLSLGAVALIFLLIEFLLPLVAFRDRPTYVERLRASQEHDAKQVNAMDLLVQKIGPRRYMWFFAAMISVLAAAGLGLRQANTARDYLVVGNCVVLRQQGENLFCAHLSDGELTGEFEYLPAAGRLVSRKRVGPISAYNPPVTGKD